MTIETEEEDYLNDDEDSSFRAGSKESSFLSKASCNTCVNAVNMVASFV